jgi:hypothetical protein
MGQPAGTLYLWGAQLETGTLNTSTILTTSTSATRNADNVSFSAPSWLSDTQGCIALTAVVPSPVANARIMSFGANGSLYLASTTSARINDGTNTVSASVTDVTNRQVVYIASWTGSALTLLADGVTASGTYDGSIINSTVYLGSTSGSSNFLTGYVSNLRFGATPTACQ